jgi:hypothetical protein
LSSPYLAIQHIAESQTDKATTANEAFDGLDSSVNAQTTIAISDADTSLTLDQTTSAGVLKLTGSLTADRYISIPASNRAFIVRNACTGGNLIIRVVGGGGASVSVAPGSLVPLYCDATDVIALGGGGSGSTGGGGTGGTGGSIAYDVVPTGAINGSNIAFVFPNAPNPPASLQFFKNGRKQMQNIDGTLSGATWTFYTAPATGDVLIAGSYTF